MRIVRTAAVALTALVLVSAGCKKNEVDKGAFKSAIDNYLSAKQECLWSAPIKFPEQADTSNDEQTKGFDALTDAGMLTRKAAEKKRFLVGSKQVNNYDLSDKGRATWTADQSQPGYGNFCYGHPEVKTVDTYNPQTADATQYTVGYSYAMGSLPDWASSAEMKTAFPKLNAGTSPQTGTATLTKGNNGWVVQSAQPAGSTTNSMP